ncbi:flagellar basal body-associated FliL family protein [Clostridium folliculivorans]|uniref:Flagellar protein FliL n=1 Tax=Clostridium folliculivorans TaxID=2886038 RepID=A0A9W6D9B1_9CLOT|nr:flagellar basal body-associated FliL family protein [Clostridium folliculivorans]GKU23582.1 flagellar protein FliL [Clostridium folliculivorans]GKU29698.1 flagellar protein FliL [Clostridium folliculivorans]
MAEKKEKKEKKEKAEKTGGGKSNLIIIVLLVLILAGMGFFGGYYVLYVKGKDSSSTSSSKVVAKVSEAYLELGEYTVNLNDDKEKHYLKAKVSVGYDKTNKKLTTETTDDLIALQSTALEFLQSKKAADFKSENLEQVKKELIDTLNKRVTQGQFIEAYFQELIVQ